MEVLRKEKKKRKKEKRTPIARYRRDYEHVGLMLIIDIRDAA